MQKPRLVITRGALGELQERVLAQYFATGRRVKYANVLDEYRDLVGGAAPVSAPTEKKYTLAQ